MKTIIFEQPKCFTNFQWKIYQQELQEVKNNKTLDICFDCTIEYQRQMRNESKCAFPMKRLNKVTEYV
jgi:hypothetical protein